MANNYAFLLKFDEILKPSPFSDIQCISAPCGGSGPFVPPKLTTPPVVQTNPFGLPNPNPFGLPNPNPTPIGLGTPQIGVPFKDTVFVKPNPFPEMQCFRAPCGGPFVPPKLTTPPVEETKNTETEPPKSVTQKLENLPISSKILTMVLMVLVLLGLYYLLFKR